MSDLGTATAPEESSVVSPRPELTQSPSGSGKPVVQKTINSAAIARARRASTKGRASVTAPTQQPIVESQRMSVAESVQEEEEEPELELQRTTTTNTAAVRRARAARASRRSCVPAPDLSGPMMMVKQLGTQMSDLIEKAASRSESAMNLLELMSPREPEQVIFGELRLARGWGSWVPANCTLLRTKPRGGEAAEWTLCCALAADKRKVAVAGGAAEASETPRKSVAQNEDVMNIFHHQLEQVKVKDKKKFEFKIKTTYDAEHDPMAKPEESLTLRARSQEEFEGWVDALTTWSQSLGAMSLLKF